MAGFRGPLLPLALSAAVIGVGYQNPLPVPPVSGVSDVQAGYRNPLPVPPLAGATAIPPPEDERNKGTEIPPDYWREDDEILLIFMATVIATVVQ